MRPIFKAGIDIRSFVFPVTGGLPLEQACGTPGTGSQGSLERMKEAKVPVHLLRILCHQLQFEILASI